MAKTIRAVQLSTISIVVAIGIILAAGFAWAAIRIETFEVNVSNELMREAQVRQISETLDVLLTTTDLAILTNETYISQWSARVSQELAASIQIFRDANPEYWLNSKTDAITENLSTLSEALVEYSSVESGLTNFVDDYDTIATNVVKDITVLVDYARAQVIEKMEQRKDNFTFVTIGMFSGILIFLFVGQAASRYVTKTIVRPLERLGTAAELQTKPDTEDLLISAAPDEIKQVAYSVSDFVDTLSEKVEERTLQLLTTTDELKEENRRRENVEADLQIALERAQTALGAKSAFLSVMSHELRTPMNAMIGTLQLIQNEPLSNNQSQLVTTALDAGDYLVSLLTNVLDISSIESDGVTIRYRELSLRHFMKKFERQISFLVEASKCSWSMTIEKDVPESIIIDDNRLQQILTNFVGNACKFAPDSLIHLKVYMANVKPSEEIIFCLEDAGPGIALENLCSIFEPYKQVESDLNRKTKGVGLGLSICKHLSEAMDGTCEVDSKLGEGSRFYLRLPCNTKQLKSQIKQHTGKSNAEDLVESKQKNSLQIMLVDDSEINHMIASKMLKSCGHQVISVMSGEDAIDVSKTKRFDVILMDLQMPGLDGITTARKIIEINGINRNTPIIPMTANVGSEFETLTADAGMTGFIPKPINSDIMLETIFHALNN